MYAQMNCLWISLILLALIPDYIMHTVTLAVTVFTQVNDYVRFSYGSRSSESLLNFPSWSAHYVVFTPMGIT